MRNQYRILPGVMLLSLLTVPLYAYRLALKDGQTIQFEKYRATETTFFYTGADGKESAIPLADVDLALTQTLNVQERVPLNLPGLVPTNGSDLSLGEIARQQRKTLSGSGAKRVVTDDDVVHSSQDLSAVQTVPAKTKQDIQVQAEPAQKIIEKLANKSQTQLANEVVGDIQFPGRDAWEQKLNIQGLRTLKIAQSYLDRTQKLSAMTDPAERNAAMEAIKNLDWQLNVEETAYAQVAADGAQKANNLEKQPK